MVDQIKQSIREHLELLAWSTRQMIGIAPWYTRILFVLGVLSGLAPLLLFVAIRGLVDTHMVLSAQGPVALADMMPWFNLVALVAVVEALVALLRKKVASSLAARADLEITTGVLKQANQLDVAYFDLSQNQQEISRLQGQISNRLVELVERAAGVVCSTVQGLTLAIILVLIEPLVIVLVAPLFIPYMIFQLKLSQHKVSHTLAHSESRLRVDYYVGLLSDRLNSAEVRLLGIGPHIIARFRRGVSGIRLGQRSKENLDFAGSTLFAVLSLAALFYVFHIVLEATLRQEATMGDLIVFAAAMIRMRKTMEQFTQDVSTCVEQLGYVKFLRTFMERVPRGAEAPLNTLEKFDGGIEISGLNFRYPGTDSLVLENLNLSIKPGETAAIVGDNGCGKSTLVKLIAGFYPEYEGSIRLSGQELRDVVNADLYRQVSFVFQEFGRYAATVSENIAYGDWQRLEHDRAAVEELAQRVNLDERIRAMPEGYDTLLGRKFGNYEPSGGMWQRIAIARAFASDAPLLILDEPTASVDVRSEFELYRQLGRLAKDRTTILISHRFSTVTMADRIFVMSKGRIVEQGSHQELLEMGGYYAELYKYYTFRMQFDG
ncbi:MAG: ABC transporter ATP-binding protein [Pseudomonadota bacterium]